MLKHADFASEWRKSRSEDLTFQNFPGENAPDPLQGGATFGVPSVRTPYAENLDPRQKLVFLSFSLLFF